MKDKNIILGVSGGIAAYKAAYLVRKLKEAGSNVFVVMTAHAQKFITPLTFQTLSENKVYTEMFSPPDTDPLAHITLAKKADLLLVAPATANIIGKFASGIADDLLSTLFLSVNKKVAIAPAMNIQMYNHPIVKENLDKLRKIGVEIIEPGEGFLACGDTGKGRMADPEEIFSRVQSLLIKTSRFKGKKILITAGPTREPLDQVRYLSNYSSGKMGYALCQAAIDRGAEVTLISGPTALAVSAHVKFFPIETAKEMEKKVLEQLPAMDIIIMPAAVADFEPLQSNKKKIKKTEKNIFMELKPTTDILSEIGKRKNKQIVIGFAAETEYLEKRAREKLAQKHLDIIVANQVDKTNPVFGSDNNKVLIIHKNGNREDLPLMPKKALAEIILDRIGDLINHG